MKDKIQYKLEKDGTEFCAYLDGEQVGEVSFWADDRGRIVIDHTGVNPEHQGKNIGTGLIKCVVDLARAQNKRIVPACSFARAVFERHPEFNDARMTHSN